MFIGANMISALCVYSWDQYEKGFRNSFTNFLRQPVLLFMSLVGIDKVDDFLGKSEDSKNTLEKVSGQEFKGEIQDFKSTVNRQNDKNNSEK